MSSENGYKIISEQSTAIHDHSQYSTSFVHGAVCPDCLCDLKVEEEHYFKMLPIMKLDKKLISKKDGDKHQILSD